MTIRSNKLGLSVLALAALGLTAIPTGAFAQQDPAGPADTATTDLLNKPIDLDVESTSLYNALKLLFSNLKVSYFIDPAVKTIEISTHLNKIPLKIVLEKLLKPNGFTYNTDSNVYTIVPLKVDTPDITPIDTVKPEDDINTFRLPRKIRSSELITNAKYIVSVLGGKVIPSFVGSTQGGQGFGGGGQFGGGQSGGGLGGGLGGFGGGGSGFGGGGSGFGGGGSGFGGGGGGNRGGGGGGSRGGGGF